MAGKSIKRQINSLKARIKTRNPPREKREFSPLKKPIPIRPQ